jgi:hypothetical protein
MTSIVLRLKDIKDPAVVEAFRELARSIENATLSIQSSSGSGTTDHTALTNIGTNTHAQIDTHIADTTIHYTMGSISITESQISDLGTYITTSDSPTLSGIWNWDYDATSANRSFAVWDNTMTGGDWLAIRAYTDGTVRIVPGPGGTGDFSAEIYYDSGEGGWVYEGWQYVKGGGRFVVYDTDASHQVQFYHDGSNGQILFSSNSTYLNIGNGTVHSCRIYDVAATSGRSSSVQILDAISQYRDVGYNVLIAGSYTTSLSPTYASLGACYVTTTTGAKSITIPASSDTGFPQGGLFQVINAAASGDITVNEGTSVNLYVITTSGRVDAGASATIGPGGIVTVWRANSTDWYLMGSEITA